LRDARDRHRSAAGDRRGGLRRASEQRTTTEVIMAARGIVAVVGSRQLPSSFASHVSSLVGFFVELGWGIGSGGARGADTFALHAVLAMGSEACQHSLVCLPGRSTSALVRVFARRGGRFVAGSGTRRTVLLARSRRLVQ